MKNIDPQVLIIFGASGDLTRRKLIPAVFDLFRRKMLPENYAILGISRTAISSEDYRQRFVIENKYIGKSEEHEDEKIEFAKLIHYHSIDTKSPQGYESLRDKLNELNSYGTVIKNYVFYLSTPPSLYRVITDNLLKVGLQDQTDGWRRVIIEKPFGYDVETARELNKELKQSFEENQIYRIDHYLGKETVQNLLVTRFANTIFEPLWNRNYIERVEITSAEHVGVEKRGGYYDGAGAIRDMLQNHLLQLVAIAAMEPPTRIDADSIRDEKLKLFHSLRKMSPEEIKSNVIRGQYMESEINGEKYPGYRDEDGVNDASRTETFVAIKCYIDNWRWAGVPFYVRTGKRLPTRVSEVVIYFKHNHHHLFKQKSLEKNQNVLIFRIQPNEGVLLKFGLKVPGGGFDVETVNMEFLYDELSDVYLPDAYERLILDCMQGDATLFARGDSVEASWEFIDSILKAWEKDDSIPIYGYPAGTWGPENIDELIEGNSGWRNPCKNLTNDGLYCEL